MKTKGIALIAFCTVLIFCAEGRSTDPDIKNPIYTGSSNDENEVSILCDRILENPDDYYQVLGIERDASSIDILSGYYKASNVLTSSLSVQRDETVLKAFRTLKDAFDCIRDVDKRKQYDQRFKSSSSSTTPKPQQSGDSSSTAGPSDDANDESELCEQILRNKNDYYKVLGLTKKATDLQIAQAYVNIYNKLSLNAHKSPNVVDTLAVLQEAGDCLRDPTQKAIYDQRFNSSSNSPSLELQKFNKPTDTASSDNSDKECKLCETILESPEDFYKMLDVPEDATTSQINRAYKLLALRLHPDKNPAPQAEETFKLVGKAAECLKDPTTRANYDRIGVKGCITV